MMMMVLMRWLLLIWQPQQKPASLSLSVYLPPRLLAASGGEPALEGQGQLLAVTPMLARFPQPTNATHSMMGVCGAEIPSPTSEAAQVPFRLQMPDREGSVANLLRWSFSVPHFPFSKCRAQHRHRRHRSAAWSARHCRRTRCRELQVLA